ncbi:flavin reductase family protein [Taibaiella koreensis]|uniref:flavin reductase family protein n=1 Tax=Taibaiella koreensis TaxID=1268548 RepID=UPI000E59F1BE|nr:iron-sulfur cluster-binding domain-containing protein [Taibaiella koreensis]
MPELELPYEELIIQKIITETPDTKTFVLQQASGTLYTYKAGQFLTLVFPRPSGEQRRSYSLSSAPGIDPALAITVKRVENGEFSRYFIDHAQEGERLLSAGVGGLFTLPDDTAVYRQVFFVVAGSGITPVFSLIKTILKTRPHLSVVLIYSNRSAKGTIFYEALIELAQQSQGRLIIDFLFSTSNNILKSRLNNSLLASLLSEYGQARPEEILCYICGPVDYMDTVSITLLTEGIPRDNIKKENFVSYVPELTEQPPDTDPHQVSIKLKDRTVALTVQFPVSILHQAQKEGIALPYSCESGQCGSCAARCTRGRVWIAYNEVLTDKELNEGLVLTCQGFPIGGDVTLEYD